MPNVLTRREHNGAAPSTTLSSPIASGSDTTFVIASGTNWPTGSTGVFIVTIDRGQSTEERILCASRTGTTITVTTRGYDGTTAQAHAASATVEHTIAGVELDELNLHGVNTSTVHGVAGNVVGTSDTQTLTNKTLTAPNVSSPAFSGTATGLSASSATLDAASTIGGVSGTSLAADRTAWTAYTPATTNVSGAAATGGYKQIGKILFLRVKFPALATGTATWTVALPGGFTAAADQGVFAQCGGAVVAGSISAGGSTISFSNTGSVTGPSIAAVIEVA